MRALAPTALLVLLTAGSAAAHPPDEAPIEVTVSGQRQGGDAATRLDVSRRELSLRPVRAPGELLEAAPGVVVVQHAGGGKANQYFLRGFDADHGTDVALFVNGVPLNLRSHGHGQGYADFNFVIPELVERMSVHKGPYDVRFGDFATAGAIEVDYLHELPENLARGELGRYGHRRAVLGVSPRLGEGWSSLIAAEVVEEDGPFAHPEALAKTSVVGSLRRELDHGSFHARLTAYAASWNASGQLPLRAVCDEGEPGLPAPEQLGAPCVERFGSLDPSEGGRTQRHAAELGWSARADDLELSAALYGVRYRFGLYSNFTFYARDPERGDGIEQTDARALLGGRFGAAHVAALGQARFRSSFGVESRADDVDNGLYRQRRRERLETVEAASVAETSLAAFVEEDAQLTPWLSLLAGLRLERLQADVEPRAGAGRSGAASAGLALPKFGVALRPATGVELFGQYGRGFHSNDARSALASDEALMTPALGYEAGARWRPHPDVQLYGSAFLLDLASELVWIGDEGTSEASAPSRRLGVELGGRVQWQGWLFADLDVTLTRARFETEAGADRVPLAPTRTLSAGLGAYHRSGEWRPFGAVRLRAIAERPANEDGSLRAAGYALVDLGAGLRHGDVEAALDLMNLFDVRWRPVNFATESRLPYEPEPVTSVHFVPGWPRTWVGRATLYWR